MYTFGLKKPAYSFGLGTRHTLSYEVSVSSSTLRLLGHALDLKLSEHIFRSPYSATLVFTANAPNLGAVLPEDYFLDSVRIEQHVEYIYIAQETDSASITNPIDIVQVQQILDSAKINELIDVLRAEHLQDIVRVTAPDKNFTIGG